METEREDPTNIGQPPGFETIQEPQDAEENSGGQPLDFEEPSGSRPRQVLEESQGVQGVQVAANPTSKVHQPGRRDGGVQDTQVALDSGVRRRAMVWAKVT